MPSEQFSLRSEDLITSNMSYIRDQLSKEEIAKIDMGFWGDIILKKAKDLSFRTTTELLAPISIWMDDEAWLERFENTKTKTMPDWANYKRKSRKWTRQQRQLAGERLRRYLHAIRVKKQFREKVSHLIGTAESQTVSSFKAGEGFLSLIVQPFSRPERNRMQLEKEFIQFAGLPISSVLPWRVMIVSAIKNSKKLSEIESYFPENPSVDKVCKFMNLLQLSNEGVVSLSQEEPFGDVEIRINSRASTSVVLKDRDGNEWNEDWIELGQDEKEQRIKQIKSHQVICRQVGH